MTARGSSVSLSKVGKDREQLGSSLKAYEIFGGIKRGSEASIKGRGRGYGVSRSARARWISRVETWQCLAARKISKELVFHYMLGSVSL